MLRARLALVTLTLVAVTFAGCARKKNPEIRLGSDVSGSDTAETASNDAFAPAAGSPWKPGGAPAVDDAASGMGSTLGATIQYDDATNSLAQNANTDGVDSAVQIADLEMVHFDYDQSDIRPEWQTTLDSHAEWLLANPSVHVQVEGHCDERGTEEYNISLGQRRADAIREYLVSKGVEPTRISTISYGKLRPLTFDQNDEAHALNRRGMFLVYTPDNETMTAGAW